MLTTPKKNLTNSVSKLENECHSLSLTDPSSEDGINSKAIVFENGTMIGEVIEIEKNNFVIPQIIITTSKSSNSLNVRCNQIENRKEMESVEQEQQSGENTALLNESTNVEQQEYSEYIVVSDNNNTYESPSPIIDTLSSSNCSVDSHQSKRTRRKSKKCNILSSQQTMSSSSSPTSGATGQMSVMSAYPPLYTAIFLDNPHHHHHHQQCHPDATNVMGQIASAAASSASSPFLTTEHQYQYHQLHSQQAMGPASVMSGLPAGHHLHRTIADTATAVATTTTANGISFATNQESGPAAPLPAGESNFIHCPDGGISSVAQTSTTTTTTGTTTTVNPLPRSCFRKWFTRPSLPLVIGILALGGVACTLGGIVLGSTGLIEHSTQYLSAALLMIGIGVSLMVISGAIWRLSIPDDMDECPCYRHMEMCRTCNSPYCNNRLLPGAYHLYPEFQHRPPPPSYLTSLNECANMGLIFHPAAAQQVRVNTPPPVYRSTNSLSVYMPVNSASNRAGVITAAPMANIDQNALTMSTMIESLHRQNQPITKEINYLELD